jgi:capsular polysaccharide biosynthesis protein
MNEITLSQILKLALKRLWIIILVAIVLGASVFCFFEFAVSPRFRAKGSLMVTNGAVTAQNDYTGSKISSTDITASLALSDTVTDILSTPDIFKLLSNSIKNKYSYTTLSNSCTIQRRNSDTLFIDIFFTAATREEAIELTNTYLSLAPDYISQYLPDSRSNIATGADKATQVYPQSAFYAIIGALLGALLTFAIAFVIDMMDNTIKGEEYFKNNFDIPLLGAIPDFENYGIANYSYNSKANAAKGGNNDANK